MKFYFIRHGESEANVNKVFSNRGLKHGLTSKGIQQARETSKIIANYKIDLIYSSPLLRAQQTTEILLNFIKCSAFIADELREADAGLEDKTDNHSWYLHFEIMQQWLSNSNLERKINDGESFIDIKNRFVPFIENLFKNDKNILFVSHGGLLSLMFPIIFENIDNSFIMNNHLPNCAVIISKKINYKLYCTEWCGKKLDIISKSK